MGVLMEFFAGMGITLTILSGVFLSGIAGLAVGGFERTNNVKFASLALSLWALSSILLVGAGFMWGRI
jgi:hypothetical protein